MDKKLLLNIEEYRTWAWEMTEKYDEPWADEALGLLVRRECWDHIRNDEGEWVDIDEDGNILPEDTAETVALEEWVENLVFPVMAVYVMQISFDHFGTVNLCFFDFVSYTEFPGLPGADQNLGSLHRLLPNHGQNIQDSDHRNNSWLYSQSSNDNRSSSR